MRNLIFCLTLFFVLTTSLSAQKTAETIKIEADSAKGFSYPFYLYIPAAMREDTAKNQNFSLLVIPNNTGVIDDDLAVHEANVKQKMMQVGLAFGKLNVPVIMPVFPRPKTDWKIYTHALDRDAMLTEKTEYKRFDLQMAAMIEAVRERFAKENLKVDDKVLMYGFSAAGMFVNRFAFLHPDKVKAVASGAPGGWAIAPVEKYKGKTLRYPLGVNDFKEVSGKKFDAKNLQNVAFFFFMGAKDDNDSLPFNDGYETEDKDLAFELFGKTPFERWEITEKLYADAKLNAEIKLYPDTPHKVTPEMITDVQTFLEKYKAK